MTTTATNHEATLSVVLNDGTKLLAKTTRRHGLSACLYVNDTQARASLARLRAQGYSAAYVHHTRGPVRYVALGQ